MMKLYSSFIEYSNLYQCKIYNMDQLARCLAFDLYFMLINGKLIRKITLFKIKQKYIK